MDDPAENIIADNYENMQSTLTTDEHLIMAKYSAIRELFTDVAARTPLG